MALSGFNTPITTFELPVVEQLLQKRSHVIKTPGILSDMDGTLIDSTTAIIKHWERIGQLYNIDPKSILATSHGRRSIDVFETIDPSKATWEYVCQLEREVPLLFADDAKEIPGARDLINSLGRLSAKWAIVTSGTRPLVEGWLKVLELVEPEFMVTAEAVKKGKPDPECYRLGAQKLGLDIGGEAPPLVLEDAPAGIKAGKAAGCKVLALATTHRLHELKEAGADWIVPDLRFVNIVNDKSGGSGLEVHITNVL